MALVYFFIRVSQPLFTKVQERVDYLNQALQENFTGIRIVKAFVRKDHENNRFEKANDELYVASVKIFRNLSLFMPFITLLMNLGTVAVIYFGGIQVFRGTSSIGEIIAFINYLSSAMFSVMILSSMVRAQATNNDIYYTYG
jgi:ATP-binding cassette subfamily B protein